jgi:hypothetical protein
MMLGLRDPQKVFNTHDSCSVENIPLVKLQLGKVGSDDPMVNVCTCGCRKYVNNLFSLKNWVKLHQTSCEHKLNVFLSKIKYADNYHMCKPFKYLAFCTCEQNPRG